MPFPFNHDLLLMMTLLIATRNAHKANEIRTILGEEFSYLTLNNFPTAPAVVEDAGSFSGNATKKAVQLAQWISATRNTQHVTPITSPAYVLADDSGLEVDALHAAPGVHSARFATTSRPESSAKTYAGELIGVTCCVLRVAEIHWAS
jgi:XTP/dITP diphosphohydrolase